MRFLLSLLLVLSGVAVANAQPASQRFTVISFHDVVDRAEDLDFDAVTTDRLAQFFDRLKATGWTAISLDDLDAASRGIRPLPARPILLTFDDGYRSLYTRVFPLLKVYRFPAVAALVGGWMETRADGKVQYGDVLVPRSNFVSWAEAREMQASGLMEFASHSYDMHRGVQANPQGSMTPSAVTWRYDPASGRYADDSVYLARIRGDLTRARNQMAAELGRAPRAMVWPFGRYSGLGLGVAKSIGFRFAFTLEAEPAYVSDLFAIHRYFPTRNPPLGEIFDNLRFAPERAHQRRIACLRLDELAAVGSAAGREEMLGTMIESLRTLGANTVVIEAFAALPSPGSPLGDVFFPTSMRPMRADLVSRVAWQLRNRAGVEVYVRLPIDPAVAAIGRANLPKLYGDMAKYTVTDGIAFETVTQFPNPEVMPDDAGIIRRRRESLDPASLTERQRVFLEAYRATAAIDPRQRLMLLMHEAKPPPEWADFGVLPPQSDAAATGKVAAQFRAGGWLKPEASGRIAFSLPVDPSRQVEALRVAQRQGGTGFALCPQAPVLRPSPALSGAFSASTYPYRP